MREHIQSIVEKLIGLEGQEVIVKLTFPRNEVTESLRFINTSGFLKRDKASVGTWFLFSTKNNAMMSRFYVEDIEQIDITTITIAQNTVA